MQKIQSVGIGGSVLIWLSDFLTDRSFGALGRHWAGYHHDQFLGNQYNFYTKRLFAKQLELPCFSFPDDAKFVGASNHEKFVRDLKIASLGWRLGLVTKREQKLLTN